MKVSNNEVLGHEYGHGFVIQDTSPKLLRGKWIATGQIIESTTNKRAKQAPKVTIAVAILASRLSSTNPIYSNFDIK